MLSNNHPTVVSVRNNVPRAMRPLESLEEQKQAFVPQNPLAWILLSYDRTGPGERRSRSKLAFFFGHLS